MNQAFKSDVLFGLNSSPKSLPCKWLYDSRGSALFEAICDTPEYYVTRTELSLLRSVVDKVASLVGPNIDVLEPGAGAGIKIQLLLDALQSPRTVVPIEISPTALEQTARTLKKKYPELNIEPVVADFTSEFELPAHFGRDVEKKMIFFPGSTISNFGPEERRQLLSNWHDLLQPGDFLFIGADLIKDRRVLERAYNDKSGITAQFNLNLLERIARELQTNLDPSTFRHRAFFNEAQKRIEMHLESRQDQSLEIEGQDFSFSEGESIHTENSYKFSVTGFQETTVAAGFCPVETFVDENQLFSLHLMTVQD
ncbi:MAG: L-histidine N(alpha)-methyltransferase [Polyangiaceae bacterium]|nr:L-histidine N(alpha)-methyltransferase [Polyangiaceae bacterium]